MPRRRSINDAVHNSLLLPGLLRRSMSRISKSQTTSSTRKAQSSHPANGERRANYQNSYAFLHLNDTADEKNINDACTPDKWSQLIIAYKARGSDKAAAVFDPQVAGHANIEGTDVFDSPWVVDDP
jgi:hypothetical protein